MTARWEIIHGDCLDVMRGMADFDHIITDPPYGVGERCDRKRAGRSKLAECNDFDPVLGDDQPFDPAPFLSFPSVCMWGANHFASRLPDASCWLAWDKRDGIPSNDNADCELAWTNWRGPARLFVHRWNGMIKASESTQRRIHPTQKPIALMLWIVERWTKPDDLILDPFCGSGTTGVACLRLGRRFIGIEKDAKYAALARERLQAEESNSTLKASRAGQVALFGDRK